VVEDLTESIFGYKKVIVVDTSSLIVLNRQNRIDIPLYRPVWNMVKADISSEVDHPKAGKIRIAEA